MIFATVGTQLPFDRLIDFLDKWHLKQGVTGSFAQIGEQGKEPKNMPFAKSLTSLQFAKKIANCKVIVSHAGMGTILTALQVRKPVVIMPRQVQFGEHRNDHQLATANNLRGRKGIHIADDEAALLSILDELNSLEAARDVSDRASPELLSAIRGFIEQTEACHA
jgi:UDP-N-acetylglucosamine transferase subunit ALG13